MNKHFLGIFENANMSLLRYLHPATKAKDPFIQKKLSDYYFSKLIPDFYYVAPGANNYYPTIIAARVTITSAFLFLFAYVSYKRHLSKNELSPKKYRFNIITKSYLNYEKELLLSEKIKKNKIILN